MPSPAAGAPPPAPLLVKPAVPAVPAPTTPLASLPSPAPTRSLWRLQKPIPEGLDRHSEADARSWVSADGWPILGGRVRGKKHKHEGTDSDDWFEAIPVGPWTILVVSDGGGSYRLSRVGAKSACEAALHSLLASLKDLKLADRTQAELEKLMEAPDIRMAYAAIAAAMQAGMAGVEELFDERKDSKRHCKANSVFVVDDCT